MGCELDLIPAYMLKRYFGLRSFSTLYGLIYSVFAVAGAACSATAGSRLRYLRLLHRGFSPYSPSSP